MRGRFIHHPSSHLSMVAPPTPKARAMGLKEGGGGMGGGSPKPPAACGMGGGTRRGGKLLNPPPGLLSPPASWPCIDDWRETTSLPRLPSSCGCCGPQVAETLTNAPDDPCAVTPQARARRTAGVDTSPHGRGRRRVRFPGNPRGWSSSFTNGPIGWIVGGMLGPLERGAARVTRRSNQGKASACPAAGWCRWVRAEWVDGSNVWLKSACRRSGQPPPPIRHQIEHASPPRSDPA